MENILILSTFDNATTVESFQTDATANQYGVIQTNNNALWNGVAGTLNSRFLQIITKTAEGKLKTSVPVDLDNLIDVSYMDSVAEVLPVYSIGKNIASASAISVATTEVVNIVIQNKSYNRTIDTARVSVSATKKASETVVEFLTRVVAKLNTAAGQVPFYSASLATSGSNHQINITALTRNNDIVITIPEGFEGVQIYTVTPMVVGVGHWEDIKAMELDFSRNSGNSGYEKMNEAYFNEPSQVIPGTHYNTLTFTWRGTGVVGSSTMNTGTNTLTLASSTPFTELRAGLNLLMAVDVEVEDITN